MTFSYSKEFSAAALTSVENVFIYEYMPSAPENYVKVYLYGLFLCNNSEFDKSIEDVADALNLTAKQVLECFSYWEDYGLVSIISENPFTVKYLPVFSAYRNKPKKYKAEKYADFTKGVQAFITSRMISTNEYSEYFNIMDVYSIKPEAMLMIVKYCVDIKGGDIGCAYISKVAKDFGKRGITTVDKVEKELSSYIVRTAEIQKILGALKLKRKPEIEDLNLLKKWSKELCFDFDAILFAAEKLKKGSMEKLDAFLIELYSMKSFSKEEISEYAAKKQYVYDLAVRINRALSLYVEVLDPVVDTYTKKWLSYGFDEETLLYVAGFCFKNGENTLIKMDELIEKLYAKGLIDLTSVSDYFEEIKTTDLFIKKVLTTAGINRRPNDWDRNNLANWKNWNFSDEMILEAAALSSGKPSPIPYINGILSNWKREGIYTLNKAETTHKEVNGNFVNSQEAYNVEYEKRRNKALSIAQKNTEKAMNVDGFSDVYGRLNSIERDLAFAEIGGDKELLIKLENEKSDLHEKAERILSGIGLTLSDLSPKFLCDKCHDTGYVGTKRCDCFDKKPV